MSALTDFLSTLFPDPKDGDIEIRTLPERAQAFGSRDDLTELSAFVAQHAHENVYFGVATRVEKGGRIGGGADHCHVAHALWADFDFKHVPEAEVHAWLELSPTPPSIIIRSGGGLHVYWLLKEAVPADDMLRSVLRRLALLLKADMASAEPARVLRLPDTLNHKYTPPRPVVLEALHADRRYTLADFEWLPDEADTHGHRAAHANGSAYTPGWADTLLDGVLEGNRDDTCWRLIGRYAQKGLSKIEVTRLMVAWAESCTPPFPIEAVLEKIERRFSEEVESGLVTLPLTEAGDAERMALLFGNHFRWVPSSRDRGEWLAWDGLRWAPGRTDVVRSLALETARAAQGAALRLPKDARPGGNTRKKILRHSLDGEDARRINAAVQLARIVPGVTTEPEKLNTHPFLLNVANGTLDLRTGQLRKPDPADMLTQAIPIAYDPIARAPRWERFLAEVFQDNADVTQYVQRAVGSTLTGSIQEQCFFLLHGGGENGKSTFIGILNALLGEYAVKLDQEAVLFAEKNRGRGASPELMRLEGKRLAFVDEMERGRKMDEARIKALTGSEESSGRNLHENTCEFRNTAKLWFDLNDLPEFSGTDRGIARRPRVIPFDRRFAPHEQDKTLLDTLKAELPGILAWAVRGCLDWQQNGLNPPESVALATRQYVEEQNNLPVFLRECYEPDPRGEVSGGDLQSAYDTWCRDYGETALDWQRQVTPFLKNVAKLRHRKGMRGKIWTGLRRVDEARPANGLSWPF